MAEIRQVVENFWRIRASLRLLKPTGVATEPIRFVGITQLGSMTNLLADESIGQAHAALSDYAANRLARDMFNALIAVFERRLISCIALAGGDATGTLGGLQTKVERIVTIAPALKEELDEVRERRNALAHHDGCADIKYVAAAGKVTQRAPTFVPLVSLGASVVPDGPYLTYASDVFARYSAAL